VGHEFADTVAGGVGVEAHPSVENEGVPVIFGAPDISEAEIQEVVDTLRSGWIGTGPKVKQFEAAFADYLGVRHAVATNSGTAALHLSLDAIGVGPGDEVITTPLTFVATANVIEHCGATPVFADVSPRDGNIDPDAAVRAVTPRTKAILPVHYAGAIAPVDSIVSRLPDLPVVADAAHAVEARYADGTSSAGRGAVCAAYSFYVTKNLVTGEGGMLATNDDALAERARVRSLHGLDNDAWARYSSGTYGVYELVYPGFKYNMTDIQASLGIHQLRRVEHALRRRIVIWNRYNEAFSKLRGITVPPVAYEGDRFGRHARHLYTLWFDWAELESHREEVVEILRKRGVGTGWHFKAVHLQKYYRKRYDYSWGDFPVAENIADRTVSLPLSSALTDEMADRVIDAVRSVVSSVRV
jgi:dTDP-4-amino-4,6-dideoxygalactose transaminase